MDFLKIINSLEEFLYEAMSWLLFYPLTLWRSVTSPLALMAYSDQELSKPVDQQYLDSVSPPLFLMLSLLINHGLEVATHVSMRMPGEHALSDQIFRSHETLLLVRSLLYGLYPLLFSATLLKRSGQFFDREHLRAPFYAQCCIASPFAIQIGLASLASRMAAPWLHTAAAVLLLAAIVGFLSVETRHFQQRLGLSLFRSFLLTFLVFLAATFFLVCATLLLAVA